MKNIKTFEQHSLNESNFEENFKNALLNVVEEEGVDMSQAVKTINNNIESAEELLHTQVQDPRQRHLTVGHGDAVRGKGWGSDKSHSAQYNARMRTSESLFGMAADFIQQAWEQLHFLQTVSPEAGAVYAFTAIATVLATCLGFTLNDMRKEKNQMKIKQLLTRVSPDWKGYENMTKEEIETEVQKISMELKKMGLEKA